MRRRLGKRLDRKERTKAGPERYPDEGPCGLAEAYEQLSRGAYAIWLRMSVADRAELRMGRGRLSKLLGYSRRQGDELLRELERKGFVMFVPHGPWRRTIIVIVRKPLLERGHNFTRFASLLFSPISEMHFREQVRGKSVSVDPPNGYGLLGGVTHLPISFSQLPVSFTQLPVPSRTYQRASGPIHKSLGYTTAARTGITKIMHASTSRVKRQKFIAEGQYFDALAAYRDQIVISKKEELDRRRLLRSSNRTRRDARNSANRARGIDVLDWNDLDIVTFDPRRPKHRLMCKLLERKPRDPGRTALVKRLETEFCRLYTRYRRAAERAAGRPVVAYEVTDKERKYAAAAGILCVQRGVTPRQLMEFWHANIKHFRRASHMTVPTLSFLSAPANIDTVACGLVLDETAPGGSRIGASSDSDGSDVRPKAGNSFSDTARLDARLRPGLEGAGFSTRELNDRYLLTVQKNALGIANGRDIFIGRGPLRDMSLWVAANLYAK
jgi:hypothetical protein